VAVLTWPDYTRFAISLFATLSPPTAIPIYLSLTQGETTLSRSRTAGIAAVTVFGVLVVTAFAGNAILAIVGTSLGSFRIGGGLVLLLMALSMLSAQISAVQQTPAEATEAQQRAAIGVVPLGIPLLAGPGAITAVIVHTERGAGFGHALLVIACIAAVVLAMYGALRLAIPIGRRLGVTGLSIMNRLFGLVLAAIAVEIMAAGVRELFPRLLG
jgi:multiple antibiotic resistance protein